jgi:tetratricopeptide (TPR) repeat protein
MRAKRLPLALFATAAATFAAAVCASQNYNPTLAFLEQRVADDPIDAGALNRLALAYVHEMRTTGDMHYLELADRTARASLAAGPEKRNPGGLAARALVEFEQHHFKEAVAFGERAISIDPGNRAALGTIGDAELELGNYAVAERIFSKLGEAGMSTALTQRASRLAELHGNPKRAIELLEQNLEVPAIADEEIVWTRVRLSELYFRAGKLGDAERQLAAARELRPEHYLVLEHLGELRGAQGRYDEAIALYGKAIERAPRPEFQQALGDLYVYMGQPDKARPWHELALRGYLQSVERGNAHYYHHLAGFYCDVQENHAEALRWARKDIELRQSIYAHDTLAWALYKNGDFAAAAQASDNALSLGTRDAHLMYHAGIIYSRAGKLAEGTELLKRTLEVNPFYNAFHEHR